MELECNCCIVRKTKKHNEYYEEMKKKYDYKSRSDKITYLAELSKNIIDSEHEHERRAYELKNGSVEGQRHYFSSYNSVLICDDCKVFFKLDVIKEAEKEEKTLKTKEIIETAKEYIIAQDSGIKSLSIIFSHQKLKMSGKIKSRHKNNPLVIGSTGTGKTYVLRTLAKLFDLPFITVPATAFTAEGWSGANVSDYLTKLNDVPNGNYAIVLVDEFDKISTKLDSGMSQKVDSFNGLKQERLLTTVEGEVCINDCGGSIDTSKMLFVFAGAFQDLVKPKPKSEIGFLGNKDTEIKIKQLTKKDIAKNGFKPELMGRISEVIQLNELTEKDYKDILLTTKDGYLSYYEELFLEHNTSINISEEVAIDLSRRAFEENLGARALNTVLFESLSDKLLESEDLDKDKFYNLSLTKDFIENNSYEFKEIIIEKKEQDKKEEINKKEEIKEIKEKSKN
jgi:ATP-dependent Clp protease ATP-binding subunit ClpX